MAGFTIQERFELKEQRRGEIALIFLKGRMDKPELDLFNSAVTRLRKEGRLRLIADFSEVTAITTLTVAGLVMSGEVVRRDGGEIVLSGIPSSLGNVFEAIDATHQLKLQPDVVAAIKSMSQPAAQPASSGPSGQAHR